MIGTLMTLIKLICADGSWVAGTNVKRKYAHFLDWSGLVRVGGTLMTRIGQIFADLKDC